MINISSIKTLQNDKKSGRYIPFKNMCYNKLTNPNGIGKGGSDYDQRNKPT